MSNFLLQVIFIFYVLDNVRADNIAFGVAQSLCGQHQGFLDSGDILPPVKERPPNAENKCAWYLTDKVCIKESGSNCVTMKTCEELGLPDSKTGRSAKKSGKSLQTSAKNQNKKSGKSLKTSAKNQNKKSGKSLKTSAKNQVLPQYNFMGASRLTKFGRTAQTENGATSNGAAVYVVKAHDEEGLESLRSLEREENLDFYAPAQIDKFTQVQVSNKKAAKITQFFESNNIEYNVAIPDLQKYFAKEQKERNERRKLQQNLRKAGKGEMTWDAFYNLTEIESWLEKLTKVHANLSKLASIGKTHEGKKIHMVKICKGECGKKPGVLIESGIHAREWASVSTGTYLINELIVNAKKYGKFLDKLDFYLIPIFNPDGYAYSWSNSSNSSRGWRKNRSPIANSSKCDIPGELQVGVDLNRNFGFHWNPDGVNDTCSDGYPGPKAFSEKESVALKGFVLEQQKKNVTFVGYVSLHAFIGLWLMPWSYTREPPPDFDDMLKLGVAATKAMFALYNKTYTPAMVAQIADAPGSSIDWMKGEAKIKYSSAIEVRPTMEDIPKGFGFDLPLNEIIPCAEEAWAGIQVALTQWAK